MSKDIDPTRLPSVAGDGDAMREGFTVAPEDAREIVGLLCKASPGRAYIAGQRAPQWVGDERYILREQLRLTDPC